MKEFNPVPFFARDLIAARKLVLVELLEYLYSEDLIPPQTLTPLKRIQIV